MTGDIKPIDPKYGMGITFTQITGLTFTIEPVIVKISTGEPIPDEEPKMIFRARDRNALRMLRYYRQLCAEDGCTAFHMEGMANRIAEFARFAAEYPGRMKQPGVTKGL